MSSERAGSKQRFALSGDFKYPLHIDFTVTSERKKSTVRVNDQLISGEWLTNSFGLKHTTLSLELDHSSPITIVVE